MQNSSIDNVSKLLHTFCSCRSGSDTAAAPSPAKDEPQQEESSGEIVYPLWYRQLHGGGRASVQWVIIDGAG